MLSDLRQRIPGEEFDYQLLLDALSEYKYPRNKIVNLLKNGDIIRIKKGIYIFGPSLRRNPYSHEVLANMIYGPSYISLGYALSYYGLIPEKAVTITSVTFRIKKHFQTPIGLFTYKKIPQKIFPIGINHVEIKNRGGFYIASKEKAVSDTIYADRGISIRSLKEMKKYLFEDLRIDPDDFLSLNSKDMHLLGEKYSSVKIKLAARLIDKI